MGWLPDIVLVDRQSMYQKEKEEMNKNYNVSALLMFCTIQVYK